MKSTHSISLILLCCSLFSSCIVPFEPKELIAADPVLVVEGNISLEAPFDIVVSRTVPLSQGNVPLAEEGAKVEVVDQNGKIYSAESEVTIGRHSFDISGLSLDQQIKYFLRITTADNVVYESEPQLPIHTPPFEVTYVQDDAKREMRLMVNSFDVGGNSKYYMWSYKETWDYTTLYTAYCMFDNVAGLIDLNGTPYMHRCWGIRYSSDLYLANTDKLSEDRIRDLVIQTIPYGDNSITEYYMISVTQTVLSEPAYRYMENMRKNSNDIGGLFSPQPNEVQGNITCITHPDLPAVGYVLVGTGQSQTLLVDCTHLPPVKEYTPIDTTMSLRSPIYELRKLYNEGFRPYYIDFMASSSQWTETRCVDCRARGGSPVVPDYWPEFLPRL